MINNKFLLYVGLALLITGIILGALGAHALKTLLNEQQIDSFKTGVFYQLLHSAIFISFGLSSQSFHQNKTFKAGTTMALTGVLLFSASIYLLSISAVYDISLQWLGPVTPLGGLLMIAGWLVVFASVLKK